MSARPINLIESPVVVVGKEASNTTRVWTSLAEAWAQVAAALRQPSAWGLWLETWEGQLARACVLRLPASALLWRPER